MRALPAVLLLVSAAAACPPAAAYSFAPWIGWDLRCDTQELRLGEPRHAWRLVDGFSDIGEDGRMIAGEGAALLVLGAPGEETTIHVEARSDGRKIGLTAELNGRSLGELTFRRRPEALALPVPPGAARRGLNVLRLRVAPAKAEDSSRLTVRRIGVTPLRCRGQDPAVIAVTPGEPLSLSRRSLVLIAPAAGPPRATDLVEISFRARPPTALSLSCWSASGVTPMARLSGSPLGKSHRFLPVGEACAGARGLELLGEGPAPAQNVRVELGPDHGLGWRGRIRLQMALLLAATTLALGSVIAWRLRRRRREDSRSGAPWHDVCWIVLVALVPRIVFWAVYRGPGEAGDSFEYLLRAGLLTSGQSDLWRDLDWHTWGSFIRPPGYFALLALFDAAMPSGRMSVIALQLVLSAATAGVTYLLALPLFGRLAAWCAALLFALYLGSITTFTRILAEPLFMFLLAAGLAGVAWLVERPSWKLAFAAGVFFGLAALVRPGPIYYPPLAGLLLVPTLGWQKGLRLTAALVLGLAALTVPWSVRNSLAAGRPVGVETVSVANFLINHPDETVVPFADLDLTRQDDRNRYRARVHSLGPGPATTAKGYHVRRILTAAVRDPATHLRQVAINLRDLLGPVPDQWLRWILRERNDVWVARLTSLLNWQYGLIQLLAALGFLLYLRRARYWPVAVWFFLNTALLTFFFHSLTRYREPTTPVLMAFAGAIIAAAIERLSVVKQPSLS